MNRPDVHLYDNHNYFDGATRLVHDGHVRDPSKLYGYDNTFVYDQSTQRFRILTLGNT
ncbi:hypothetical protein [Leptospira adleri]|uniref:hypothetical protein n=1 Tax=Leptospira adleri TaxID=2023186 RepID=UPI0014384B76|nr:hypothetical protein [Leptospira adleri]